jgi:class 3 adenylate cyclase
MGSRLASKARAGEVLVSEEAVQEMCGDLQGLEQRQLELKGLSGKVDTRVLKVEP